MALGQLDGCEMGLTLDSEEGEVPHLRWSQAPPLPWPRPGSADNIYLNDFRWTFQSDILKPLLQQVGLLAAVRVVPSQRSGKAAACVLCSTLRCMR